jgi:4-amino-4-deoxy-L-arabinose transferase-like glycosyltransferase
MTGFLLSITILTVTTLLIVSLFHLSRISETILAWSLVAFAVLVFVFQFANLFGKLNVVGFILFVQFVIMFIVFGLWMFKRRPKLFPKTKFNLDCWKLLKEKQNWPLIGLMGGLTAALGLYFVLIYVVPPNNVDALSIHLARVLKWKQSGSYFPWETRNVWQVSFPVNAQLTYLWTILFTNSDHYVAYIPYLAGLVTALVVYLLAREIGFSVRASVFAGAVWLAFPVVQLHLTSVRHDLISTWLFMICLYLFYRWGSSRQMIYMILSGIALGLVVGTNFSIATYLPGLLVLLLIGIYLKKHALREMLLFAGTTGIAFVVFSSPVFISNVIHFGSPVGPDAAAMTSTAIAQEISTVQYLAVNITRWIYQFLDFSVLPKPIAAAAVTAKSWMIEWLLGLVHLNLEGDLATMNAHIFNWETQYALQEDEAWYGLIGAMLVFPTTVFAFLRGIKKRDMLLMAPLVFLMTGLVTCSLIRPGWTPYDGRYFMPLTAMCAALLPMWFEYEKTKMPVQYVVMALSVLSIMMTVVYNPAKQIVGGASVWNMNRIDQMTRQSYSSKEMLYLTGAVIPGDAVVGIASDYLDYQEYGVYGEEFARTVIDVFPPERISDSNWLAQHSIEYLLVLVSDGYPDVVAEEYQYVDSLGDWIVYSAATHP